MNSSQSNSPPPSLPTLSAPNKTLASNKPPRRQSTFSNSPTSTNSPLARSPTSPTISLTRTLSSDLPDITTTLSQLSPPHLLHQQQQQQTSTANTIKQTIASTTSSFLRRPSSETLFNPAQSAALKTLASSVPLNSNDSSFWAVLLKASKFPSTHSANDAYDLEMATVSLSIELAANNVRTRNFNKLVLHLLSQIQKIKETKPESIPTEAYNALFLTRVFSKHFAGNLTNDEIIQQFEDNNQNITIINDSTTVALDLEKLTINDQVKADRRPRAEQLLDALLSLLINMDPNANYSRYEFYVEVLNTLLVLLSTQLYRTKFTESNYFLEILLERFSDRADAVVAKLLENFIEQKFPPPQSSSKV
ncbi:Dyggve-Melchior-Clausen syndrome protein-domain-containing protein [Circinella umbellata]|nr:Dyggve-Melchior-Clausen syndrome protein-domain-containing protein [Circinella umbellata]